VVLHVGSCNCTVERASRPGYRVITKVYTIYRALTLGPPALKTPSCNFHPVDRVVAYIRIITRTVNLQRGTPLEIKPVRRTKIRHNYN
jgi:hypothetical protein